MNGIGIDRSAVRRLRLGVVSSWKILDLSVGVEPQIKEVKKILKELKAGAARACFIDGEWGTGKTHLMGMIRMLCRVEGCGVAYFNLNGNSAALNHPQRFYHLIATRLQVCDASIGLPALVNYCMANSDLRDRLLRWVRDTQSRSEFALSLALLISSGIADSPMGDWSILLGSDLAHADYPYIREKALRRIGDLSEFVFALGFGGLVLEIDELETMTQLWNVRSRLGAYSVLGRLISMNRVLPVFAVTERFNELVESDWTERLSGARHDIPPDAKTFLIMWDRREYLVLKPVTIDEPLAYGLVRRVVDLYRTAYGSSPLEVDVDRLVKSWSRTSLKSPRTLIRRTVFELDRARPLTRVH